MITKGVVATTLRSLPTFAHLSEARLNVLAAAASQIEVARHQVVVREGDQSSENVYFVLSGGLRVSICDAEGREVILSMLGAGDVFGELGVIDDHPRSATVEAVEPTRLVVFSKHNFLQILADNFDIALSMMRGLAARLRLADQRIESLALLDVYGRVARLLLELAEIREGQRVVTRRITKQDLAKMVGASREMVSRVMKDLTVHGLIEEHNGELRLIGDVDEACR